MKTLPNQLLRGRISYILFSGLVVFHLAFNSRITVVTRFSLSIMYSGCGARDDGSTDTVSSRSLCFRFRCRASKQTGQTDTRAITTPILKDM